MKNLNNTPRYYRGINVLFKNLFLVYGKYYKNRKQYPLFKFNLISITKLRKKLDLKKIIEFNGKYYSTMALPGFPSKVFDNMIANGGLNFEHAGTSKKTQIDNAFLAITNKCKLNCSHCYEKHNLRNNSNIPVEKWCSVIDYLQNEGTSIIVLTGGDPIWDFEKTLSILKHGDKDLSEFHIHTSGYSITEQMVKSLKKAGLAAAAVGLEGTDPEKHDEIRGVTGSWVHAINALKLFNKAGTRTYVNFCLNNYNCDESNLHKFFKLMKSLNVSLIQILEPRPCGALIDNNMNTIFNAESKNKILEIYRNYNLKLKYKNYPLLYYVHYIESPSKMGCMMGGLSHFYIDSAGNVNPCVFVPVSFGNIITSDVGDILKKMRRSCPHPLHKECPSVALAKDINRKLNVSGSKMPIRFEELNEEWRQLYSMDTKV